MINGFAQCQYFRKIHLVHGLFGKDTTRHLMVGQAVKISRFSAITDGINDDKDVGFADDAHEPDAKHPAVKDTHMIGKIEPAAKGFNHSHAHTFVAEQNIAYPKDGDSGITGVF